MDEYTVTTSFEEAIGYFGPPSNDKLVKRAQRVRRLLLGKFGELSDDMVIEFVRKYKAKLDLFDDHVETFVSIVRSKSPFAFPKSTMILRFEDEQYECPVCKTIRHRLSDLIDGEWLSFSDGWTEHHRTDEEMACIYCQIRGADILKDYTDDCIVCANCIAYGRYGPDGVFQSCDQSEDTIKGAHQIKDTLIKFVEKHEIELKLHNKQITSPSSVE
jgi:hypothetical protein